MIIENQGGEYGKYFIQNLREPDTISAEFRETYKKFASRILWIDDNIVPGAFQMNTAWYKDVQPRDPLFDAHVHDYDELIGFFGSNPENQYDLGGVIEFSFAGEVHKLDRTTLIFVPGGIEHNPLRLIKVDTPIFHFSVVMNPEYSGESTYYTAE